MQTLEQVPLGAQLHARRYAYRDQVFHLYRVYAGALYGYYVVRRHYAYVRHQRRRGHAPAVAQRGYHGQHVYEVHRTGRKGVQNRLGSKRHAALEIGVIVAVQRDRVLGTDLKAMLAHGAVVVVDLVNAVLAVGRERVGVMVARGYAQLAVYALVLVPNQAALERVYLVAGAVGHAAHGDVLARAAKAAGAVALYVRKVDQHVRVVYKARYVDVAQRLVVHVLFIEILAHVARGLQYGTA